ncbi:MAG: hypothetical protein RR022_07715 [Angelakisella sp.]
MANPVILRYFLGANSSQGFVSRFDQLGAPEGDWRCTIIKGGPGSGKSNAMKKLAAAMADCCDYIEELYCSSDVESLDGVIFPDHKLSIADGTPPHGMGAIAHNFKITSELQPLVRWLWGCAPPPR